MEYWGENPPVHVILSAVHLKKTSKRKVSKAAKGNDNFRKFQGEIASLGIGGFAGKLPAWYRDKN